VTDLGSNVLTLMYFAVALLVALVAHEYAHALAAVSLGDQTPRMTGRLGLNPRPLIDPFGTVLLPGLLLLPVLFGASVFLPFAYAKPMPLNPWSLRGGERQTVLVGAAGPVASLILALMFGLSLRVTGSGTFPGEFLLRCLQVNVIFAVINLVPIPPLDGARMIGRFLSPRAREVFTNLEQYGALFILAIFFLLPGPIFAFVNAVGNGICALAAGERCFA
jgi:Zn-dependent protease